LVETSSRKGCTGRISSFHAIKALEEAVGPKSGFLAVTNMQGESLILPAPSNR